MNVSPGGYQNAPYGTMVSRDGDTGCISLQNTRIISIPVHECRIRQEKKMDRG
jgi:hypothetical protein